MQVDRQYIFHNEIQMYLICRGSNSSENKFPIFKEEDTNFDKECSDAGKTTDKERTVLKQREILTAGTLKKNNQLKRKNIIWRASAMLIQSAKISDSYERVHVCQNFRTLNVRSLIKFHMRKFIEIQCIKIINTFIIAR